MTMNTIETALINKVQQLIIQSEQAQEGIQDDAYSTMFKDFLLSEVYHEASDLYVTLERYLNILSYLDQYGSICGIMTKSILQVKRVLHQSKQLREGLYK